MLKTLLRQAANVAQQIAQIFCGKASTDGIFKDNGARKIIETQATAVAQRVAQTIWGVPDNTPSDEPKRTAQVTGNLKVQQYQPARKPNPAPFAFEATYSDEYTKIKGYANDDEMRKDLARLVQLVFRHMVAPEAAMVTMESMMVDGKANSDGSTYIVTGRCAGDQITVNFRWASFDSKDAQETNIPLSLHRNRS